jgi:hypothetical protein
MAKGVIYVRHSMDLPFESLIKDQVEKLTKEAAQNGVEEFHTYVDEPLIYATEPQPAITALIQAANAGSFDAVFIDELTRVTMVQGHLLKLAKRLEEAKLKACALLKASGLRFVSQDVKDFLSEQAQMNQMVEEWENCLLNLLDNDAEKLHQVQAKPLYDGFKSAALAKVTADEKHRHDDQQQHQTQGPEVSL